MGAPRLRANFLLSDVGLPLYVERDGKVHYWVRLSIVDPPADATRISYALHETFTVPVRGTEDRDKGFPIDITTFGDFTVRVAFEGSASGPITGSLATLLAAQHGDSTERSIRWALSAVAAL